MKRFVQRNGHLYEVGVDYIPEPRSSHHVMTDIKPYKSMLDGSIITSRSHHREHLRQHGCVEVGNDSSLQGKRSTPQHSGDLKQQIAANVYSKLRY